MVLLVFNPGFQLKAGAHEESKAVTWPFSKRNGFPGLHDIMVFNEFSPELNIAKGTEDLAAAHLTKRRRIPWNAWKVKKICLTLSLLFFQLEPRPDP